MTEARARPTDGTGTGGTGGDAAYRTRVVLALLRRLRAERRAERRRSLAFTVYSSVLLFAVWCGPLLVAAARAGAGNRPRGPVAEHLLSSLPTTLPALTVTVVLLTARRAVWRGPVAPEQAALTWLLPLPVLRRAVLLPCFATATVTSVAVATTAGALTGFLLHTLGAGPLGSATAAGAATGAAIGLTGTSLAALVQRHGDASPRLRARLRRTAWAVTAALWGAAAVSLTHGPWAGERAVMWSGPWGWAALPLLGSTGRVPAVAGWAGAALTAAVAAAAARGAVRAVPRIPTRVLRAQAGTALRVQASLYALDLRQARAAVRAARPATVRSATVRSRTGRSRPRLRLPYPRTARLLIPWRDATALLRAPGRAAWSAGWAALTVGLLCLDGAPAPVLLLSLPTGYLAAVQLAEAARLETDDVRRAAQLPWSAGGLALRHGLVPAAGLLILFAGYAAAAAVGGLGTDRLLVLPALVPALVAAALVSAYRGVVPAHLMLGTTTPLGDTGPLMAVLWQLRGPLVALGSLAAVDGPARGAEPDAVGLLWPLAVGAGLAWWAATTARGAVRGR